jgi:cell wall-associated NlpC family hydrolase
MTNRRIAAITISTALTVALGADLIAPAAVAEASPMVMTKAVPQTGGLAETAAAPAASAAARSFAPALGLAPAPLSPFADIAVGADPLAGYAKVAIHEWYIFLTTGLGEHLRRFIEIRDSLATAAATQLEIDPERMKAAWAKADHRHQLVLMAALTQLGTPYRKRVNKPGRGFDCSGFTSFAWAATNVMMPTQSRRQINMVTPIDPTVAQAGDLVYYPGHIALYLGVDQALLHAADYGTDVTFGTVRSGRTSSVRFGAPLA